jgi:uncharacterized protein
MVLLCHGIGMNRNEYLGFFATMASLLAQRGHGSLRIDFRGHGRSPVPACEFTVGSQLIDVRAARDFLRRQGFREPVDLMGCSFGAAPCIVSKANSPQDFGRVTLLAPVLDYRAVFIDPVSPWGTATFTRERLAKCASEGEPIAINDSFSMHPRLLASLLHSDVLSFVPRAGTLTIIHGESDDMVPVELSMAAAERHANVRLVTIPDMEHGFTHTGDKQGSHTSTQRNIATILHAVIASVVPG